LQKNGQFDRETYDLFLKYGISVQARVFEEHLRENLMMAQVFEQTTASVTVSSEEIRKAYEAENNRTRVKYVSFPFSGFKDAVTFSDNDLKTYYDASTEQFRIPPQINVAYVGIDIPEDATEEQKIKWHDQMKTFFSSAKKTEFDQAAQESGLGVKETGLFGLDDPIPGFGWQPQLSTLLFDLTMNATSKII
jgi:peptidyl-prolyl cis-trans isomerase D